MNEFIKNIILNISVLVAITILYTINIRNKNNRAQEILIGIFIGLVGIFLISISVKVDSGIFFDSRSILVCISGMFLGVVPTTIAVTIIAGYRNSEIFLQEDLEKNGRLVVATEDGSVGTKGNVLDAVKQEKVEADVIFACGPTPMLRAIKAYALENDIPCYVSLEEKMACGIGACLACVCKSTEIDDHSQVKNKRVCKEGPVFNVKEVEL